MWTLNEFWDMAHAAMSATAHLADARLQSLATADLPTLRSVLTQYRWFTGYYPGDLSILVWKLAPSRLRSFVGSLVHEELGAGEPGQAHLALYDSFLAGLGVTATLAADLTNPNCVAIMDSMRHTLLQSSAATAIGLRGMGGECLCQVYLQAMHQFLVANPIIDELRRAGRIDWRFWDIHAGEEDEAHARLTREGIAELVQGPEQIAELAAGYREAESKWRLFWHNAFDGQPFVLRGAAAPRREAAAPLARLA